MLNHCEIESKLINMAEAVRAEVAYDIAMNVDDFQFYGLFQQKVYFEELKLNNILYNSIQY